MAKEDHRNAFWRKVVAVVEKPIKLLPDKKLNANLEFCGDLAEAYQCGVFSHNNCGGFCCKAGQGQFANLLRVKPALYAEHEAKEEALRTHLGKNVSMMTDRTGDGKKKPLTMKTLRLRIEAGEQVDMFDIGGCGCFA